MANSMSKVAVLYKTVNGSDVMVVAAIGLN